NKSVRKLQKRYKIYPRYSTALFLSRTATVRPAITFVSFWFLRIVYWPVPPAGEYPRSSASNSDMNSPSLVLPQNRDPSFQYLPERVFTHTSVAVDVAGVGFVSWTLGAGGLLPMYFW